MAAACARSPAGVGAADPHDGARQEHLVAERQYGEPARQLHRRVRHGGHANRVEFEGGGEAHRRTAQQNKKRKKFLEGKKARGGRRRGYLKGPSSRALFWLGQGLNGVCLVVDPAGG